MNKLHISPRALADLDDIKRYIEKELENPDAALNTLARITKAMRSLTENPDRGAQLSRHTTQRTDYRYLIAGNYLVFYRTSPGAVYVARVLYKRRDYVRALLSEIPDEN